MRTYFSGFDAGDIATFLGVKRAVGGNCEGAGNKKGIKKGEIGIKNEMGRLKR